MSWLWRFGRWTIAGVWLYEGLWKKLLTADSHHFDVVASVPWLSTAAVHILMVAIGGAEVLLAGWVLTRKRPCLATLAQTLLLVGMNTGGLIWSRTHISDPPGMVVHNAAFIALIWVVGIQQNQVHAPSL